MDKEELLTTTEAMKILKVKTRNTVRLRIEQGLKCYGTGKSRRFKYSDIMSFMEGNSEQ
jgi:excisionase family DNA binding protein